MCVVLSSVGCRSPRLRSRSLRRAATDNEDAAPVGPAAATAVVPMGKGDRGGKGASKSKKKVASQRGKGKSVTFDEEDA